MDILHQRKFPQIQQNFTVRFQQFIKLAFLPVDSKKTVLFKIATVATKLLPTKTMTQTTVAHPENVKHGPLSSDPSKTFTEVSSGSQINYGTLLEFFHSRELCIRSVSQYLVSFVPESTQILYTKVCAKCSVSCTFTSLQSNQPFIFAPKIAKKQQ